MSLIIQKYGGTSVANPILIAKVAERVIEIKNKGDDIVVVLSAMAGVTDQLIQLAREVCGKEYPDLRELDVLLATGEQTTVALLAMKLKSMGYSAESVLAHQAKIQTSGEPCDASIMRIESDRLKKLINQGIIPIVAGFQGCDDNENITTLGRGGSDTSAVAIAIALGADLCEILTDVKGVYTANPTDCESVRKIRFICFDDMLELASLGAKVLHPRSVDLARKHNLKIHLRSSFSDDEGTMIVNGADMESPVVTGIVSRPDQAQITFVGVGNFPGEAARVFGPLNDAKISVDMITQPLGVSEKGQTANISFTIDEGDMLKAVEICEKTKDALEARKLIATGKLAKVSVVGSGMKGKAGVAYKMFHVLADKKINIFLISTSEIKISVVIDGIYANTAVNALHAAFKL